MSLRIRKDGRIFCAAHSESEEGDLYLDDEVHEIISGCRNGNSEPTFYSLKYNWDTHEYERQMKIEEYDG